MKNRGLSSVIASVLLVLITISLIVILSGFLIPFVKNSLSQSTECKFYEESYVFNNEFELNCKNGSSYIFSVENKNENNNGFDILLVNGEIKKKYSVRPNGNFTGISMLDGEMLSVPKSGEIESYIINDGEDYIVAELYPFSGSKICNKVDEVNLNIC